MVSTGCLLQTPPLTCMGLLTNAEMDDLNPQWASTDLGKQEWEIQLNTEG